MSIVQARLLETWQEGFTASPDMFDDGRLERQRALMLVRLGDANK